MSLRYGSNIYFYNRNIKETIIGFLNLFTDIRVGNYSSETGLLESTSPVPVLFGSIERSSYINSKGETVQRIIQMPLLHFELTGLEKDKTRVFAMKSLHMQGQRSGYEHDVLLPLPYNFTVTLNIYAKYQEEIMQLIEQIEPKFNYHLVYYRKHPIFPEEVTLSHWASITSPPSFAFNSEYSAEARRDILAVPIGFTIESWMVREAYDSVGVIKEIIANFNDYATQKGLEKVRLLADPCIRDFYFTADPLYVAPTLGSMVSGTYHSGIIVSIPEAGHFIVKFNNEKQVFLKNELVRVGANPIGTSISCEPYEPFNEADYGWSGYSNLVWRSGYDGPSGWTGYSEVWDSYSGYSEMITPIV